MLTVIEGVVGNSSLMRGSTMYTMELTPLLTANDMYLNINIMFLLNLLHL